VAIVLILQGCATQQLTNQGQSAYQKGDYDAALQNFEQVIQKSEQAGNDTDAEVYFKAGRAAWELGQTKKAIRYLEKAEYLEYPSPRLYTTLARAARSIDNLSKELDALENYRKKFPKGEHIDSMSIRLFETYVESENWNKGLKLWPEIKDQAQSDVKMLTGYLKVNQKLENDKTASQTAQKILEQDPDNLEALEWMGKKYFWKAEDVYVKEMTAYKNNRTTSQYKRLLNKLDKVYPTFEKARDYFLKLYKLEPKAEYAEFLGNIYKRLQEEQKAEYYYQKAR
jgi:tetratricopeptide (TPR) repeat protein